PWVPPLTSTTLSVSSAIQASSVGAAPAGRQSGLASAAGRRPASTSVTPRAAAAKVAAVAPRVRPIRWGGRTTSGGSNRGWGGGGSGAETARAHRAQGGGQVEQPAPPAVDQDRPGPDPAQERGVDEVAGGPGQGGVEGQHVAGPGPLPHVRAV